MLGILRIALDSATMSSSDENSQQTLFVNFNQAFTSLAVATRAGYRVFALNNVDRLETIHHYGGQEGIALVERLFDSSLVAFVRQAYRRKLTICDINLGTEITRISYYNTILAIKLNRSRVVVCLEETLFIHNIKNMRNLYSIRDTPANPRGICALTTASYEGATYLAYPGSTSMGIIQLFDAEHLCEKIKIKAHNSPLAALAFNAKGSLLASASETGTVIRVFSVIDGTPIYELRRGLKRCATIYSLAFNAESTLLACASNTKNVHIFKLDGTSATRTKEPSEIGILGKVLKAGSSYLPTAVSNVISLDRSFATARLPFSGNPSVVALTTIDHQCRLLVASTNGFLCVYNVDVERGGECFFWRQHILVEDVPGTFGRVYTRRGINYAAVVAEGHNERSVSLEDQIQEASRDLPHALSAAEFPPLGHESEQYEISEQSTDRDHKMPNCD